MHGRTQEAAAICSQLAGHSVELAASQEKPLPWSALYSRAFIRRTILTAVPWFLMDICLYGIGLFTPVILATLGFGGGANSTSVSYVLTDLRSTEGAVFLDMFLIIGFALAIWLIDRVGRIHLQMLGFLGMTAGLLLVGLGSLRQAGGSRTFRSS